MHDTTLAVAVGMQLRQGDTLVVDNGSLSMVFMSGAFATIVVGESLQLGSDLESCVLESSTGTRGPKLDGAVAVPATGSGGQRRPDEWRRKLAYAGGVRGESGPVALSPRLAMSAPVPEFVWFDPDSSGSDSLRSYTLVLRDGQHRTLLREKVAGRVNGHNRFRPASLPAGFAADSGRRYSWGIFRAGAPVPDGELDAKCIYVDPAGIAGAAAYRREVDSLLTAGIVDSTSALMMRAMRALDDRERLFADAVPLLLDLTDIPAARRWSMEQLIAVYLRFGNRPTAVAALLQRRF
jgi:hypothetical protein